jgi:hypothetical protein
MLRRVSAALLLAVKLVEEVVEDLLGQPPFVARQTKAHAPVRPLDHPAVPHFALFFAHGVRRNDLGIRYAVSPITNYDGYSLAYGCGKRMGSVNPAAPVAPYRGLGNIQTASRTRVIWLLGACRPPRRRTRFLRKNPLRSQGVLEMELAKLEPATSGVRLAPGRFGPDRLGLLR